MRLLLDTHLILWAARDSPRLPDIARSLIDDPANTLLVSVASIWEIAIKHALGRPDFDADPRLLRSALLANGYEELPVQAFHALAAGELPGIHQDPFDRLLIAQAATESVQLLTADATLAAYGKMVRVV